MRRQLSSHFCPGKVPLCTYPTSGNAGQEVIELSELKETNLSLRSFMSGSAGLRAPQKRHFFMELKTSGSSISSESFESSDGSDSTCSTSMCHNLQRSGACQCRRDIGSLQDPPPG